MKETTHKRFTIGIDPGKNTGLAVYDRHTRKLAVVKSLDFWGAYDFIVNSMHPRYVNMIIIELPHTSSCNGMTKINKKVWHDKSRNIDGVARTGVHVGSSLREAELLVMRFKSMGYSVVIENPKGKVNKKRFQFITGYSERTNQHARDAGMLCYGI